MSTVAVPPGRSTEPAVGPGPGGRGVVDGLVNPHPIAEALPALLQEDDFCVRLTQAFDDVLAPVYAVLDCIDSYLDPAINPEDFLDYMATWVGVEIDENWPVERRRLLIPAVVDLYRMRGTSVGLGAHVELYTGVRPEILENGGCLWSQTADTPLPGSADPFVTVRLHAPEPGAVNRRAVQHIVDQSRPAHLFATVEVVDHGRVVAAPEDAPPPGTADDAAPGAVDLPGSERIEMAAPGPESQEPTEDPPGPDAPSGKEPSE